MGQKPDKFGYLTRKIDCKKSCIDLVEAVREFNSLEKLSC